MSEVFQSAGEPGAAVAAAASGSANAAACIDRRGANALACVLEDVAAKLAAARALLVEVAESSPASVGACALVEQAGALADRATRALGGFRVMDADDWVLSTATRDALSMLATRSATERGAA